MSYVKPIIVFIAALLIWTAFVIYTTLGGWWHNPITSNDDPRAFMDAARELIDAKNVGNVAIALIENGIVYEEYFSAVSQQIDRETIFPAASMSKWITALGVMKLVQSGKIGLDQPIGKYLTRWQLPPSEFDHDKVTVRTLLSHTSGLADGLGFGDYEPDETLPSLETSLQHPRASSGRDVQIKLARAPGTEWDYSGGGYLILQLIIEEVSGQSFATYMQTALFDPVSMPRSTYQYIGSIQNSANSYDAKGQPATSYQYAASAATGFSTSLADMVQLVQAQLADYSSDFPLSSESLIEMRTTQATLFGFDIWGLGTILYAPTAFGDVVYGHDGQNDPAINSAVRINPDSSDAIIVFTTGNQSLATTLGFEWVFWQTGVPDFLGIGYLIDTGVQIMMYGSIAIVIMFILILIRRRVRWEKKKI